VTTVAEPLADTPPAPGPGPVVAVAPRRTGGVVRAYVSLTKPRIVELLLITTALCLPA